MIYSVCLFLLASAVAPAADATTTVTATSTVNVLVTDRSGKPLPAAHVRVNGESPREGNTNKAGRVVFTDMKAGSYILRVERDKFITFEKDFAVRDQRGSTRVIAAISPTSRPKAAASARSVMASATR
jgi:hypothetical protein